MGNARLCSCGHIAKDHKYYYQSKIIWGECEWLDCECKTYTFSHETPAHYASPTRIIIDEIS